MKIIHTTELEEAWEACQGNDYTAVADQLGVCSDCFPVWAATVADQLVKDDPGIPVEHALAYSMLSVGIMAGRRAAEAEG